MNNFKHWLGIGLLASGIATGWAGETRSYSLKEAQQYALENNRDIRTAALGIKVANKQLWEVTASGFPQVEASAGYQNLLDIPTQLIPGEIFGGAPGSTIPVKFGKPHGANYGISLSQLVFSGSYLVGVQASRVFLQLSEQQLARTQLEVKATVTNTYYLILLAEENRKVLVESLENLKKTHFEIKEMYQEGFTEETDVKQLQISLNQLENGIRTLDQQLEIARQLLKLQMGLPLTEPIALADPLARILNNLDAGENPEPKFDVNRNTSFKAMITQEKLAGLSLRKEKMNFLPSLVAFASFQKDAYRDEFNIFDADKAWYPTSVVGVKLSWPLFSGTGRLHRLQKSNFELQQARLQREQVENSLQVAFQQARSALNSARDQFKNARANRDLAQEVYDVTREKFREGLVSSLGLTQAHNQYLDSERNYLQSVSDVLTARTNLEKLLETL
jgi:outer membrane protein TolC